MKTSVNTKNTRLTLADRLLSSPIEEKGLQESKKAASPARRKRKKKDTPPPITIEAALPALESQGKKRDEVLGVFYIALSLVLMAGLIIEQKGQVKIMVSEFARLNGVGPVFLALFAFYCGVRRLMGQAVFEKSSQILAFPIMYFSFIGFLSSTLPPLPDGVSLGGLVGKYVTWFLYAFLGKISTSIVLGSLFLVSFMHVTEIYVSSLAISAYKMLRQLTLHTYKLVRLALVFTFESLKFFLVRLHRVTYIVIDDAVTLLERYLHGEKAESLNDLSETDQAESSPDFNELEQSGAEQKVEEKSLPGNEDTDQEFIEDSKVHESPETLNESPDTIDESYSDQSTYDDEEFEEYEDEVQPITIEYESSSEAEEEAYKPGLLDRLPGIPFLGSRGESNLSEEQKTMLEEEIEESLTVEEQFEIVKEDAPKIESRVKDSSTDEKTNETKLAPENFEDVEEDEYFDGGELPDPGFLQEPPSNQKRDSAEILEEKGYRLVEALASYNVTVDLDNYVQGPTITRYELRTAPGTKLNKLRNLTSEIAMSLEAKSVRIEAPIPGTSKVGIEVPNAFPVPVYFKEVVESITSDEAAHPLSIAFGKGIDGHSVIGNLAKMPHLLVAGATGAGKSVCVNTLISSILFRCTPQQVKFVMVDPKQVEFAVYKGIPHLISDVVTDPEEAAAALRWGVEEMEQRYTLLSAFGVRHIDTFNKKLMTGTLKAIENVDQVPTQPLPYIVIIVDELADLMMVAKKDVETSICRIAQKARAVGIHLVIATQRPSVDVITGLIKANLPSRIAFMVTSGIDSKTILDQTGAENLLGRGDMLFLPGGQIKPDRVQGAFMTDDEVAVLVDQIKSNFGEAEYEDIITPFMEEEEDAAEVSQEFYDDKFNAALDVVAREKYVSTSMLQRHLGIGYNRAARIVDVMYARGVCGGQESGKKRKLAIPLEEIPDFYI